MAGVGDDDGHPGEDCGRTLRAGSILATLVVALAALTAGCGSGAGEFSAEEFVDEANSHGAGLELGGPLESQEGAEIYEVTVEPAMADSREPPLGEGHSGGTIRVADDPEDAEAEYARCEEAASLFCYRAANIALILDEDAQPEALAQVAAALRAMQAG